MSSFFAKAPPLPPPSPPEVVFVRVPHWHEELLLFLVFKVFTPEILIGFGFSIFTWLLFRFGLMALVKFPLVALLYLYDCVRSFRNPFKQLLDSIEDGCARRSVMYMADYNKKLEEQQNARRAAGGGGGDNEVDYSVAPAQPEASQGIPNGQLQQQQQQPPPQLSSPSLYARLAGRR